MRRQRYSRKDSRRSWIQQWDSATKHIFSPLMSIGTSHQRSWHSVWAKTSYQWELLRPIVMEYVISIGKVLGSGAFGYVYKAVAFGICSPETDTTVAVKKTKPHSNRENYQALMMEVKIMSHLGMHLNVVNFLGACTKDLATGKYIHHVGKDRSVACKFSRTVSHEQPATRSHRFLFSSSIILFNPSLFTNL